MMLDNTRSMRRAALEPDQCLAPVHRPIRREPRVLELRQQQAADLHIVLDYEDARPRIFSS